MGKRTKKHAELVKSEKQMKEINRSNRFALYFREDHAEVVDHYIRVGRLGWMAVQVGSATGNKRQRRHIRLLFEAQKKAIN